MRKTRQLASCSSVSRVSTSIVSADGGNLPAMAWMSKTLISAIPYGNRQIRLESHPVATYNLTCRLGLQVARCATSHEERQMTRTIWFLAVLFAALITLGAGTTSAQTVDARKAVEAAAKAMGTTNLKSIQFTADGYVARVGEQYNLTDGW